MQTKSGFNLPAKHCNFRHPTRFFEYLDLFRRSFGIPLYSKHLHIRTHDFGGQADWVLIIGCLKTNQPQNVLKMFLTFYLVILSTESEVQRIKTKEINKKSLFIPLLSLTIWLALHSRVYSYTLWAETETELSTYNDTFFVSYRIVSIQVHWLPRVRSFRYKVVSAKQLWCKSFPYKLTRYSFPYNLGWIQ